MKLKLNTLVAIFVVMGAFFNKNYAQQQEVYNPAYIFDADSLQGFDEEAARHSAISEGFVGKEFKVRMNRLKRSYINDKYNLWGPPTPPYNYGYAGRVVPGCTNEDFEGSTATATITTGNQIAGWTLSRGTNSITNANSCNLNGCCNAQPVESAIFVVPSGYVDPIIGSVYPIYSVFGTSSGDPNAESFNPQIPQGMNGDNFIRINSDDLSGGNAYSIEKLSKTFSVTANNALFQFAFISVFSAGHSCCDAGAFKIRLYDATSGTPTLIACPSFSASALSSQCTNTATGISYLNAQTGTPANVNSANIIFNKWQISSMDLSSYINHNITIEIIASDCTGGGHYGYVYFDAQCGPMVIYGNNTPYQAGSSNITVPTCGASGATLCAAAGLGPYYWNGPSIAANSPLASPSYTNSCIITTISATYSLFMNPPGSCSPIVRTIQSTVTPAATVFGSAVQAQCGQTLAVVNVTPSGSASTYSNVSWTPIPLSINSTTTTGTFVIPPGPAATIVTITVTDPIGCKGTTTVNVNPAPPQPTFGIQNVTGSQSITCLFPSVDLSAITNYTYGTLDYFWSSTSSTYSQSAITLTTPGVFTVIATDPVTNCSNSTTVAIGINTTAPSSAISPTLQTISCTNNGSLTTISASNPTVNVSHIILNPLGGSLTVNSYSTSYSAQAIGVYTCLTINGVNGCATQKTFSINSFQGFPTFSLSSSPSNFTLGCNSKSLTTINITGASATSVNPSTSLQIPTGGPVTYTLLSPSASTALPTGTLSGSPAWPVTVPGTWSVVVRDANNGCETRVPVSVISNTAGPSLDSLIVPETILSCKTPSIVMRAVSLAPNVDYAWSYTTGVGLVPFNAVTVSIVSGGNALTPPTFIANYTLTMADNSTNGNTCVSRTVVPMFQNLFPPKAMFSIGEPAFNCKTFSISCTSQCTTTVPTGTIFAPGLAVTSLWQGPSPQQDATFSTTYLALTPGDYTMTALDVSNGCSTKTVVNIPNNSIYPKINEGGYVPAPLDCGSTVAITPIVTPSTGVSYQWTGPEGAAIGTSTLASLAVVNPGEYRITVTDTKNGCVASETMTVKTSTLTTDFDADVTFGYAPMTVNFTNNSKSYTGGVGVKSTWSFGNGVSSIITSTAPTAATYNLPGTYTVTLFANKGSCAGSKTKIISVDIPSKLTIPNVFTPNGDGVNDVFFLKVTNLSQIKAAIYDRWGHKVYEVDTQNDKNNVGGRENVNLAWDGKNQLGVEMSEGTYFYVIKAFGKDGKVYDEKGTISLIK